VKGRRTRHGYSDRIDAAIEAILSVATSFVGNTIQARELILALCDQAGASIEVQRAVTALLSDEAVTPRLTKGDA
jgi:hypothetical protein